MNTKEIIALMQISKGATVVAGQYLDGEFGKTYHFKNVIGLALQKEDFVVVQTRELFDLVRVTEPDVPIHQVGCGLDKLVHVIQKVDKAGLDQLLAAENRAAHELAMSEVQERLAVYQNQLGGGFQKVQDLLSAPMTDDAEEVTPSHDDPKADGY